MFYFYLLYRYILVCWYWDKPQWKLSSKTNSSPGDLCSSGSQDSYKVGRFSHYRVSCLYFHICILCSGQTDKFVVSKEDVSSESFSNCFPLLAGLLPTHKHLLLPGTCLHQEAFLTSPQRVPCSLLSPRGTQCHTSLSSALRTLSAQ